MQRTTTILQPATSTALTTVTARFTAESLAMSDANFDPTNNDQKAPAGIFGLSSPGKAIAAIVVGGCFLALMGTAFIRYLVLGHV